MAVLELLSAHACDPMVFEFLEFREVLRGIKLLFGAIRTNKVIADRDDFGLMVLVLRTAPSI